MRWLVTRALSCLLLLAFTSGMACPEAADIIEQYSYTTLKPPSTLYYPGAIVAVEVDKNGQIEVGKLKLVCGPRANLGADLVLVTSATVTESMRKSSRGKWNLQGEMLDSVKASSAGSNVESIDVTLKNARIVNISDVELLENLKNRTPECTKAIVARLNAGHALTVISSAIMADLDYKVHFKTKVEADKRVRAKQMQGIALTLGGGYTRLSEHSIESRGLTLGIKTDSFLMSLGLPECVDGSCAFPSLEGDEDRTIRMRSAETSLETDSPLVLPGHQYLQPSADF